MWFIASCLLLFSLQSECCPVGWLGISNDCYYFSNDTVFNWNDSQNDCSERGGELVDIKDNKTFLFLKSYARSDIDAKFWTGLSEFKSFLTIKTEHFSQISNVSNERNCFTLDWKGIEKAFCNETNKFICHRNDSKVSSGSFDGCYYPTENDISCYVIDNTHKRNYVDASLHCLETCGILLDMSTREESYFIRSLILSVMETSKINSYWILRNTSFDIEKKMSGTSETIQRALLARASCSIIASKFTFKGNDCGSLSFTICEFLNPVSFSYSSIAEDNQTCLNGWTFREESDTCYLISPNDKLLPWYGAHCECQTYGAELINFSNSEEIKFISRNSPRNYWAAFGRSRVVNRYIGFIENTCTFCNYEHNRLMCTTENCNSPKNYICKAKPANKTTFTTYWDFRCDKSWFYNLGNCYKIEESYRLTWHRALMFCQDNNASLASFSTSLENHSMTVKNNKTLWVGLHKVFQDRTEIVKWSDNSPLNFIFRNSLYSKLYSMNDETCGAITPDGPFIVPMNCYDKYGFICKKNSYQPRYRYKPRIRPIIPTTPIPNLKVSPIGNCPENWFPFGDKCYKYERGNDVETTWMEAAENCRLQKSQLAVPKNRTEQDVLTFLMNYFGESAWIGIRYIGNDSEFVTVNEYPLEYTNWLEDYSTNDTILSDHCVEVFNSNYDNDIGKWKDLPCTLQRPYICQMYKDPAIVQSRFKLSVCNISKDWIKYRDGCYKIYQRKSATWHKAELFCKKQGGHLVTISDYSVEIFIKHIILLENITIWIGLNRNRWHRYKWISGRPVKYSNWDKNQPKSKKYCTVMLQSGHWASRSCEEKNPFFCEILYDKSQQSSNKITGKCPSDTEDWKDLGGNYCYYVESSNLVTFAKAKLDCQKRGGDLASIHSHQELHRINKNMKYTSVLYWIGLIRRYDGTFAWTDSTALDYFNWDAGFPSAKRGESCVVMHRRRLTWSTIYCEENKGYVCAVKKSGNVNATENRKQIKTPTSSLHPGVVTLIAIALTGLIGFVIGLALFHVIKQRKQRSPLIDSSVDSVTFSNAVYAENFEG